MSGMGAYNRLGLTVPIMYLCFTPLMMGEKLNQPFSPLPQCTIPPGNHFLQSIRHCEVISSISITLIAAKCLIFFH